MKTTFENLCKFRYKSRGKMLPNDIFFNQQSTQYHVSLSFIGGYQLIVKKKIEKLNPK